jgi:transposase
LWDKFEDLNNGGFLVHLNHWELEMNKKSGTSKDAADKLVKTIRRKTRQTYSAEEKIRIVLAGLRGEESIAGPSDSCKKKISANVCVIGAEFLGWTIGWIKYHR